MGTVQEIVMCVVMLRRRAAAMGPANLLLRGHLATANTTGLVFPPLPPLSSSSFYDCFSNCLSPRWQLQSM